MDTQPGDRPRKWNHETERTETEPRDGEGGDRTRRQRGRRDSRFCAQAQSPGWGHAQGLKGVNLPDLNHDTRLKLEPSEDPLAPNWTPTDQSHFIVDCPTASASGTRRNKQLQSATEAEQPGPASTQVCPTPSWSYSALFCHTHCIFFSDVTAGLHSSQFKDQWTSGAFELPCPGETSNCV